MSVNKDVLIEEINRLKFKFRDEEKKEFLLMVNRNSPVRTTMLYKSIMAKTINEAEIVNDKEWMDFSSDMVDGAFTEIRAKSIITLQSYLSIIKHYLSDTTPQTDYLKRGHLYTMDMDKDGLKKYINKAGEEFSYITPKEFDAIVLGKESDPMSKSIFILVYLGVKGHQFSDIANIREDDIDLASGMVIGEDRELCTIPQQYIHFFKEAMSADTYNRYDNDGKLISESTVNTDSEYFIKRRIGKSTDPTKAPDKALVSATLLDMQKSISNPYITATSLYLSGEAYKLLKVCDMKMPTNQDLKKFRADHKSKLSFVSMNTICRILLDKLAKENEEEKDTNETETP